MTGTIILFAFTVVFNAVQAGVKYVKKQLK